MVSFEFLSFALLYNMSSILIVFLRHYNGRVFGLKYSVVFRQTRVIIVTSSTLNVVTIKGRVYNFYICQYSAIHVHVYLRPIFLYYLSVILSVI